MNKEKHPELNSIAYYNLNEKMEGYPEIENKIAVKYLMTVLKTNMIKRFIAQGEKFEITNYFLINENFMCEYLQKPIYNTILGSLIDEPKSVKYIYNYMINLFKESILML